MRIGYFGRPFEPITEEGFPNEDLPIFQEDPYAVTDDVPLTVEEILEAGGDAPGSGVLERLEAESAARMEAAQQAPSGSSGLPLALLAGAAFFLL